MSDDQDMDTVEGSNEAWREGIQRLRARLIEEAPENLDRVDDLVRLRRNLSEFIDPIEASLLGYDPDEEGFEAVFGDTFLEETIGLVENLPKLLTSLGLETGDIRKVVSDGMELLVRYDPELELVSISTGERTQIWYLLGEPSGGAVGVTTDHRVVHVRVANEMLPLRGPQYDPKTDVLTLRDPSRSLETPVQVTENGPLVGHFALATPDQEDDALIRLDVRLASVWFDAVAESFDSRP